MVNVQWWCAAQGVAWSWTWRPYVGVWLFVAVLGVAYARLLRRAARSADAQETFSPAGRAGFAVAGILLLWAALDWPIGTLGAGYLASVHMVQFLLIAIASPPLLLLGVPRSAWRRLLRVPALRAVARVMGYPLASMAFFATVMGFTHWPPMVDGLMAGQLGSFVLDMLWLVSGLVFWWPVTVALPERSWLSEPFQMGYLIAATLVNTGVFAYLTFAELPVYATFELAPPVGGLTTQEDQRLAGLLMKVGGAVVLWTAISILFFRWYQRSERESSKGTVAASILLALFLSSCGGGGLGVHDAVVSEPVTGERAALYFTVENGGAADVLQGLEVEGVGRATLHHTETSGGMMRMRPATGGLEVPEHGRLLLRPGGDHAMLEDLTRTVAPGDSLEVTLHFRDGGVRRVTASVVPLTELDEVLDGH